MTIINLIDTSKLPPSAQAAATDHVVCMTRLLDALQRARDGLEGIDGERSALADYIEAQLNFIDKNARGMHKAWQSVLQTAVHQANIVIARNGTRTL